MVVRVHDHPSRLRVAVDDASHGVILRDHVAALLEVDAGSVDITYYIDTGEFQIVVTIAEFPAVIDESLWPSIDELVARHQQGAAVVRALSRGV